MTFQFTMAVRIEAHNTSDAMAKARELTKQVEDSTGCPTFFYDAPQPVKGVRESMEELRRKLFIQD